MCDKFYSKNMLFLLQFQNLKNEFSSAQVHHEVEKNELANKFKRELEVEQNLKNAKLKENLGLKILLSTHKTENERHKEIISELKFINERLCNKITQSTEHNKDIEKSKEEFEKKFLECTHNFSDLKNANNKLVSEKKNLEDKCKKTEENFLGKCQEVQILQNDKKILKSDVELQWQNMLQNYKNKQIEVMKELQINHQKELSDWQDKHESSIKLFELQKIQCKKQEGMISDLERTNKFLEEQKSGFSKLVKNYSIEKFKKDKELDNCKEKYHSLVRDLDLQKSNTKSQCEKFQIEICNLQEKLKKLEERKHNLDNQLNEKSRCCNEKLELENSNLKVKMEEIVEKLNNKARRVNKMEDMVQTERDKLSKYAQENSTLLEIIDRKNKECLTVETKLLKNTAHCSCIYSFDFEENTSNCSNLMKKEDIKLEPS